MRSGIMNGTFDDNLPSALSISGNGVFKWIVKVSSPSAVIVSVASSSFWPNGSRLPHRSIEATQSAARTGVPSCHLRPGRSVKLQASLSSLTFQVSTIWGCGLKSLSTENSVSKTR
jgi:hypothetical protein